MLGQRIDTLSKGFKRRVGLAQAILHDPAVLIMDEPTDGLDPNQKHDVRALITDMAKDKAIIVSTHILEEVEAVCTRAVVIDRGRIVADGTAEDLQRRMPYHNAVAIKVDAARADAVAGALSAPQQHRARGAAHDRQRAHPAPRHAAQRHGHRRRRRRPAAREVDPGRGDVRRARQARRRLPPDHHVRCRVRPCITSAWIITKRELGAYFGTPLAYIFIVIFVALTGAFAFYVGNFFERGQADLQPFFLYHAWLYLLLVPAIAMRLWAEERKSGTIELLMTLPISTIEAILGKFFAAWIFIGVALALTFPMWITVNILGNPDNGVIFAGYLGSFLMAGAFLAIGSCISALTQNQVIAFIVAATLCFLFVMSGAELVLNFFRAWAPAFLVRPSRR